MVAAALAVTPATGQAVADTDDPAPDLRSEQVWFTCPGDSGISQLDGPATWSTEEPPEGDGCSSVDTGYHASSAGDTNSDAVFRGAFTGNLDSLTVRLHLGRPVEGDLVDITMGLTVDGAERVPWPTGKTVVRTKDTPPGVVEVSVYGIGLLDEADKAANAPHDLALTLSLRGELATGAWRWGSADAPSGIVFHPPHAAETVIMASSPTEPPQDDPATSPVGTAVVAGPQSQTIGYVTPQIATVPDTTLTFANGDQVGHDVTARARDAEGKPVFRSAITTTGGTSTITGAKDLAPGEYGFYCSLHPNMTGTLHVVGG